VLESAREPLTTRDIVERAVTKGWLIPQGKTPDATMAAALYREANHGGRLVKVASPGRLRARRGSVRWALKSER
jgi:hypothetical protein